jgi:hypothetical protein
MDGWMEESISFLQELETIFENDSQGNRKRNETGIGD